MPMIWVNYNKNCKPINPIFTLLLALSLLSTLLIIDKLKSFYEKNELTKNGIIVKANIFDFIKVRERRGIKEYAIFRYTFKNEEIIQKVINFGETYKFNQILNLKISNKIPEIFEIINIEE